MLAGNCKIMERTSNTSADTIFPAGLYVNADTQDAEEICKQCLFKTLESILLGSNANGATSKKPERLYLA